MQRKAVKWVKVLLSNNAVSRTLLLNTLRRTKFAISNGFMEIVAQTDAVFKAKLAPYDAALGLGFNRHCDRNGNIVHSWGNRRLQCTSVCWVSRCVGRERGMCTHMSIAVNMLCNVEACAGVRSDVENAKHNSTW